MDRFRFVNVVWGKDFTDAFLRVCLPSQLSPRNLPVVARHTESEYWIYTTRQSGELIRRSRSYKDLSSLMPVKLAFINGISRVGKYRAMNQCQRHFIECAIGDSCSLSFQSPDIVWSDGSFARMLEIFKSGRKNIAIGSVRLTKETFLPALLKRYGTQGQLEAITHRQLVELAIHHLHPVTRAQMWHASNESSFAEGEMFWPVGSEGLVLRRFRLQPLLVTPQNRACLPTINSDADYTDQVCADPSDWYVICDSDEMCYVDFTAAAYGAEGIEPSQPTASKEAAWAKIHALRMHRQFVRNIMRFHAGDCSDKWEAVERESDAVVDSILALVGCHEASRTPPLLSPTRYLSPLFWLERVQRKGPGAFVKEAWSRASQALQRCVLGPEITIRTAE